MDNASEHKIDRESSQAPSSHPPSRWKPMLWAVVAAFGTYFCMYAFRKPFAVAQYSDLTAWEWQYKTVAVVAQVLGYMLAKFIGIYESIANPRSLP